MCSGTRRAPFAAALDTTGPARDDMAGMTVDENALRASPYFRGLPEHWLQRLHEAAAPATLRPGEPLRGERLYLLVSGEVSASTPAQRDAGSEIVGHEMPGNVFGARRLTGEEEVLAYRAVGPAEAYAWEAPDLERLYDEIRGLRGELQTRLSLRSRRSELVDLLRRTALFRQAEQSSVRRLVASATLARFEPESVICREGDPAEEMFVIVSGEISFFRDGAPDALRRLHRGDFFGEIALVQHSPRTASAVAAAESEVLIVDKDAFDAVYRRSPSFRHALRATAELRLESDRSGEPEPEVVWLVNDTAWPSESLASVLVDALRAVDVHVAAPQQLGDVPRALQAAHDERADYVLCFGDGTEEERAVREIGDAAGVAVHVTAGAAAPFPYGRPPLLRMLHVVVDADAGRPFRRDAFTLSAQPAPFADLPANARAVLQRLARAIARRRVAVALGGGAAWGLAHIALLRGLERARIPVDMLVGVSAGSLVGAFYASQGLDGLDRLLRAKHELSAAAIAAIGTTSSVDLFLRRHIRERRLEDLPLPLAAVAVEAETAREKAFWHGSLAGAVRASCSLPGVFGRPIFGGGRYLDACVRHNVPVGYCHEADADFVIACDVVPPPGPTRDRRSARRRHLMDLLQVHRLTDTVRALYWLASTSGELQAGLADALFLPNLADFSPWDFHRADAIVDRADEQLDDWLVTTRAHYEALARVDG